MDIGLYETLNGGDISIQDNDIFTSVSLWNQIYIALFGGNVEQSTTDNLDGLERSDFWGNSFIDDVDEQYNSETERILNNVSINSSGIQKIQQSVENDLGFLRKLAEVEVDVTIPRIDSVYIFISIQEPDNVEKEVYRILWDGTRSSVIGDGKNKAGFISAAWLLEDGIWNDSAIWLDTENWKDE